MRPRATRTSLVCGCGGRWKCSPRTVCRSLDFHRAAEVIETGRALTGTALDRWEERS